MEFVGEEENRAAVERLFERHRDDLRRLIPGASVEHIGSTAVPGALTKGDLDLLVAVPAEAFVEAVTALRSRFAVHQPEVWSDTFASFEQRPSGEVPLGVQLVVAGSEDESVFLTFIESRLWTRRMRSPKFSPMPKESISIPKAPEFEPGYSQAVKAGNTIYVGGTTGIDTSTGEFAGPTVTEQTRQSLLNCQAILRAAGAELDDVVMVHTLLKRPEDARAVSEVFTEFFPDLEPPRCVSRIGVDRPDLLISIAMVAVID